ncbi:methylmalonyl Co-A mutase-associated GTPase MeaB [Halopenitus sp. H-Gu1]|uniref:methylmalonyl Co-A mutase-associated GTPase MeaB n=1 Tax=Halopenitus sp. H-Gu1 TaxID=3242697 RepID=UPI00359E91DF
MTDRSTDGPDETTDREDSSSSASALVDDLLAGEHRALARVITRIENRSADYRSIVSQLHRHAGDAAVIGITGSPGAGKSTLVDQLARAYRDRDLTVGVIAVDPSSPYTGGAVLGDRIRMASNAGDMDVFFRSMSARGQLGGLSAATTDAITALDAFGKDVILIETVGAGQNEVDIVRTADTVAVLVQPGSGDDVQLLKAGILEIGDVFVINKADMEGATRTVSELEEMLHRREHPTAGVETGHHGTVARSDDRETEPDRDGDLAATDGDSDEWHPEIVETVATKGTGVEELLEVLSAHREYLESSGRLAEAARSRYAAEIRTLLRNDLADLIEEEIDRRGGIDELARRVHERETDPYTLTEEILAPIAESIRDRR